MATVNLHCLVSQWSQPFSVAIEALKAAYISGMECGDVEAALYSSHNYIFSALYSTTPLYQLESDVRIFCQQMKDFNLETPYFSTLPLWQGILNLMGEAEDPLRLTGFAMDDDELEAYNRANGDELALYAHLYHRYLMSVFYCSLSTLEENLPEFIYTFQKALRGHYVVQMATFYASLTCYRLYHHTGKAAFRRRARKFARTVENWCQDDVVNCRPTALLLKAEALVLRDVKRTKQQEVICMYQEAIAVAETMGILRWEALFTERVVEVIDGLYRDKQTALVFLQRAAELYGRWGAEGKVQHLDNTYKHLTSLTRAPDT
eukprot:CAMPEP_0116545782 /NCGR_PEP_ID=MMETSP0397-20121206/2862_1 /TAXON_ID=216820 /ORGANISM="Cyclophora tenuis, Strain ECT3854" /LENGTH=318 /DNA_ID=CAMNT_0004070139 /DNA_START=63 /DNA_END=1019 /DNA_ORIENTATION=-